MKHVGVKRRRSQDYEDFNVSAFPLLGIWSLSGFHKFGIGCEGSNLVQIGFSFKPLEWL